MASVGASTTRRVNSSLMAGWVIASRSRRASSSPNTTFARAPRSSRPSGARMPSPNRSTSFFSAGCPGSTTARATWSASTITAPRAASRSATVDLPAPIPPVSPTRSNSGGLGRRGLVAGCRRFRHLGRGLACSRRLRCSRGVALGGGRRLLGRRADVLALLVEGVLAEMLAVLGRDFAALGRLLDRQRDAPPVEIDVDDLHPQLLAGRDDLLGRLDVVRGHLGDVHEALDAVAHLDERAEGHELGDLPVHELADLVAVRELLPRILLRGLQRQRDALAIEIDVEHLHLDVVADLHYRARVVDVLPTQLGDVHESVHAAEVDERAEVHDRRDHALADLAWLEVGEELVALLALRLLEIRAPGEHDVVAVLVELDDLGVEVPADERVQVAHTAEVDE